MYLFIFDCSGSLFLPVGSIVSGSGYYSLVAVHGFLLAVASLDAEHGFPGAWASVGADLGGSCSLYAPECRLGSCGAQVYCPEAYGIFPD